jgi:uncharacterized protein (TIGR00369 family)
MRKILNPFRGMAGYHCFACSPDNPLGLKMEFHEQDDWIVSYWTPPAHLVGYKNVLHGGIQTTLMDEIAAWACYIQLDTSGMTRNMNTRFKRPVFMDNGPLLIKAKVEKYDHPIAVVKSELLDKNNELCSYAEVEYFIFPKEKAQRDLFFPGKEKFFEK